MKKDFLKSRYFIWVSYALVIIISLFLNSINSVQFENIVITITMLVIVFIIFYNSSRKFKRVEKVAEELNKASEYIQTEAFNKKSLSVQNVEISFFDPLLKAQYADFLDNYYRLSNINPLGYKGNIEEYMNYLVIDSIVNRNVTNLVSGTMTGLGILGTFIGLSLGLHSFNLSSNTDQITESIDSLMEGIKVAFHTSIYGMILSLIFNYCYKQQIEIGNTAIERFVEVYKKYVYSDKTDDSINVFMQFQKNQAEDIHLLVTSFSDEIKQALTPQFDRMSEAIENVSNIQKSQADDMHLFATGFSNEIKQALAPQFDKMTDAIENFSEIASQKQIEGIDAMVERFIESLNTSLGHNFAELGQCLAESTKSQKESAKKLQEVMRATGTALVSANEINNCLTGMMKDLEGYISGIEELQKIINTNMTTVNAQIEVLHEEGEEREKFIRELADVEKNIIEVEEKRVETINEQTRMMVESIQRLTDDTNNHIRDILTALAESIEEYKKSIAMDTSSNAKMLSEVADSMVASIEKSSTELREAADSVNKGMVDASNNLKDATELLNRDMDRSIRTTFKHFDDNLSKIYSGLSGTIADIQTTTERVPKVINASYERVIDSIDKLEKALKNKTDEAGEINSNTEK